MADLFNNLYDQASTQYGLPKDWLPTFARIESGGNPQARTGSYKGLFQLSDPEFAQHGQGNIYDPQANTYAAASKLKSQSDAFKTKYGRDPTASDLYLIHQQGEGGYAAHTANPDRPAWQNMLSTAEGQQKGAAWAKQAIWGNVPDDVKTQYGSVDNITSKQFADLWANKVARMSGAPGSGSPTLASTLSQGGNTMPDAAGKWTPAELQEALRTQSKQTWDMPVGGKYAGPGGFFAGVLSGIQNNRANEAATGNQKMLQDALRGAAGAPNIGQALMSSGVPALQGQGMSALIAEQQRIAAENTPDARLKREAAQFSLDTSKENAPLNRQKLEAETNALKQKDEVNSAVAGLLKGALPGTPAPTEPVAPGYQPMPPTGPRIQPQSGEVAPGDPNLIKTQAVPGQPGPAPAAQPNQDTVKAFGRDMPRDKARQIGEALLAVPGREALGKHLIELAGQGAGTLSKPAQHDIDKAELGFTNMLASFKEMDRLYDPKFLQGSPKISYAINNFRDKWAPDTLKKMQLNPQEAEDLRKYEQFSATAMNNLNTRLKELSGTAVTESEMQRILRELPSPGTGPFSGDGPTAFKAKLDQGRRMAQMAVARMRYLRTKGFTGDVSEASTMIPIDSMPSMIQQRGEQFQKMIEQQMPGADPNAIKIKVKEALGKEFGMDI